MCLFTFDYIAWDICALQDMSRYLVYEKTFKEMNWRVNIFHHVRCIAKIFAKYFLQGD
jgi:hypothetical protein